MDLVLNQVAEHLDQPIGGAPRCGNGPLQITILHRPEIGDRRRVDRCQERLNGLPGRVLLGIVCRRERVKRLADTVVALTLFFLGDVQHQLANGPGGWIGLDVELVVAPLGDRLNESCPDRLPLRAYVHYIHSALPQPVLPIHLSILPEPQLLIPLVPGERPWYPDNSWLVVGSRMRDLAPGRCGFRCLVAHWM